jgi:hypothetical protein
MPIEHLACAGREFTKEMNGNRIMWIKVMMQREAFCSAFIT